MTRTLETRENGRHLPTVLVKNLIDGLEREAADGRREDAVSASRRDDVVGSFPVSGAADVDDACRAAGRAYLGWSGTPAPIRGELIHRIQEALRANKETLSRVIAREIGKPIREARGEVQEAIDTASFFQSEGRRLYGQTVPSEMRHKELFTYRRPLGVAAMITACNFPIAVASWKILPALLAGNTIVWKPSEDAPVIAYLFARIIQEAGAPPGVLNVVHGFGGGGAGEALIAAVDRGLVQKVSFTGSTVVGRKIGEICGRNLQIPSLELGGKNPMIVLRDADLDLAIDGALFSGFGTSGQRCTSLANIILDRPIAAEFKHRFVERAMALVGGDPLEAEDVFYGPLISPRFYERFMEHYAMGHADGAKLLTAEGRITRQNKPSSFVGDPEGGHYVFPAIWDDVKMDMKIAQTEIFGPTVNLVTVDGLEAAIAAANGTPYGLSSSCYTRDAFAIERFKTGIKAGMSSVNNSTTGAEAHLPFGGVGWSGNGTRESGIWVLDAYTRWHAVNEDLSGRLQLAQIDLEDAAPAEATDFSFLGG